MILIFFFWFFCVTELGWIYKIYTFQKLSAKHFLKAFQKQ